LIHFAQARRVLAQAKKEVNFEGALGLIFTEAMVIFAQAKKA